MKTLNQATVTLTKGFTVRNRWTGKAFQLSRDFKATVIAVVGTRAIAFIHSPLDIIIFPITSIFTQTMKGSHQ